MFPDLIWTFIQLGALLAIPITVVRGIKLWYLLKTGTFRYRPFSGESFPVTRTEKPGWYWWTVIYHMASIALSLCLIGFVAFWTFHPR